MVAAMAKPPYSYPTFQQDTDASQLHPHSTHPYYLDAAFMASLTSGPGSIFPAVYLHWL